MFAEGCLKWFKGSIAYGAPALCGRAGKGWKVMTGITRVFAESSSRSGIAKKAILTTAALVFLGLMASSSGAAGQGYGQITGADQQYPQRNTQRNPPRNPQQDPFPQITPKPDTPPNLKRKQALLDDNFKKMKKHAEDLADLAKSLQAEIEKSNENVLSLEIVKKAEEAEKLAKKIRDEAKGY